MKKFFIGLFILMIVIPVAGELKFYPFHNTFRVSLAIPILFFFLLWARKQSLLLYGVTVGMSVVIFRIILDWTTDIHFSLYSSFIAHFPIFFFYFTYSCLFYFVKSSRFSSLFKIGFLGVVIDSLSNLVELLFRYFLLGESITLLIIGEIVIISVIRTFFVLGLYTMIKFHEKELEVYHQQEQNKHMLFLISGLYEETVQLKKTLMDAEHITRDCYHLYRSLQNNNDDIDIEQVSKKLLGIAGEIHEIKKDNQRIYAGLIKMISNENSTDYIEIEKMSKIIIQSNEKYASSLGKDIQFVLDIKGQFPLLHVYTILSLVNNLVSNSVEMINKEGLIKIQICRKEQSIEFKVSDNGPGIPDKKKELIFKPGYTTKYDISGTPSTGMGLSYVKEVVEKLNGKIEIESKADINETSFILLLPIDNLTERMIV